MVYEYPELDEMLLQIAHTLHKQHDDYLTSELCPYSDETKGIIAGRKLTAPDVEGMSDDDDLDVASLLNELRDYKKTLDPENTSGFNMYFRNMTSLSEKLLAMRERAAKVDQFEQFKANIFHILEDELTDDQRVTILARLRKDFETDDNQ